VHIRTLRCENIVPVGSTRHPPMNTAQQLLPGVNFLILRRDLEGKGLGVPERWAAVETETGNAQDSEPPSAHRPSCRLDVAGSLVNGGYFTIRKSNGVEARRHARPCRTRGRSCSLASCSCAPCARSGRTPRSLGRSVISDPPVHLLICYGRRVHHRRGEHFSSPFHHVAAA
jgi:hypothetical protein